MKKRRHRHWSKIVDVSVFEKKTRECHIIGGATTVAACFSASGGSWSLYNINQHFTTYTITRISLLALATAYN